MKRRNLSLLSFAVLAILLMSPAAQAYMGANILYSETDLGSGSWQYDFTFQNTSSTDATHPYLQTVKLFLGGETTINVLNMPQDWTSYTFTGSASIGIPVVTDYLEMYSDAQAADVSTGSVLGGFRFTADYRLGDIGFEALFSDHAEMEDFASVAGTTSPVPIPAAVWLFGSGLAGLAGFRRKLDM